MNLEEMKQQIERATLVAEGPLTWTKLDNKQGWTFVVGIGQGWRFVLGISDELQQCDGTGTSGNVVLHLPKPLAHRLVARYRESNP